MKIEESCCRDALRGQGWMTAVILFLFFFSFMQSSAQVGEHRSRFDIGGNAGYVLSNVGFTPTVSQTFHDGITFGFSTRYTCEKYFNTICSIYGEVNYASLGWKQDILTATDEPVINEETGVTEEYSRNINYIQVPVMAHLAWGREEKGFNFFLNLGPQFGFYLDESTEKNYDTPNLKVGTGRSNTIIEQEHMAVEKKFDYGIVVGVGSEYSHLRLGHFLLEARYYYGLGDIYKNTKRDYFAKSNFGNIVVKASYLFTLFN